MSRRSRKLCLAATVLGLTIGTLMGAVAYSSSQAHLQAEISPEQYALLANPDILPDDSLDLVRQMLVDDGKVTRTELESLRIGRQAAPAKKRLFDRLQPEANATLRLHPNERVDMTSFSMEVCELIPARGETDEVEFAGTRYQLRDFHYCGSARVSGFTLMRNGHAIATVRHFGHASAEVYVEDGSDNLLRTDLDSNTAYRLLREFYDETISSRDFIASILKVGTASASGGPSWAVAP